MGYSRWGDIVSQIESAFIGFFQGIWTGIQSFFGTIFNSIASALASIFTAPIAAINASWTALQNWASGFGPLAPILTVLVLGTFAVILGWFIWLVIKLSVSESEQTGEELEEGV